ncbi:MAG: DUF3047 domain-containing protein [Betaproteobacteria bacterium]|nr:DUF3047 domain-containing protein [Betaproteobacteria bacterium]
MRNTVCLVLLATLMLAGCASRIVVTEEQRAVTVPRFSDAPLGPPMIQGWNPWVLSRFSKPTQYRVVDSDAGRVLEAHAASSSSGLLLDVNVNPREKPLLSWTWKATELMADADTTIQGSDDSPNRIAVAFEGDRGKFDVEDRAMASMVRLVSGREMPYATVIYVWDNKLPVDSLFEHPRSSRVRVIVAESGPARVGKWLRFTRNIEEDYRRAFGEEPGRVESVGVLTDSNSTGHNIISYYGDIEFHTTARATSIVGY